MEVVRIEDAKVLGCRPDDLRRKDETTTPLNVLIRTLDKKEFGLQVLWVSTFLSPSFCRDMFNMISQYPCTGCWQHAIKSRRCLCI